MDPYRRGHLQRVATSSSSSSRVGGFFSSALSRKPPGTSINYTAEDLRGPLGLRVFEEPKDAFVELVFVHGFNGGARSTWTYNDDPATFWPSWLSDSQNSEFQNVRIHTFGYNSIDFQGRTTVANVADVGTNFLESLANGPPFKRDAHNPIVIVAHSLGGLVVKTAFNMAKQNPKYQELNRRFYAIIFLATPHRGADNSAMLNNILRYSSTSLSTGAIAGLEPNLSAIESINLNFVHHYQGLRIWSFYETLPQAGTNEILVKKDFSLLGVMEETPVALTTDHLGISRFENSSDPSFQLIRSALAKIVEEIDRELRDPEIVKNHMLSLARYLGVSDAEEEELMTLENLEVPGSCEWLLAKASFLKWRDASFGTDSSSVDLPARIRGLAIDQRQHQSHHNPRIFWLTGAPGSGKSVIAAHVVRHLQMEGRQCQFYFLKHADKSKQNLSGLLKSLAWQMACHDVALRQSLLTMQQQDELTAETNDIRAIWRQLFTQRILLTNFQQRQYWIIDALDEAHGGAELLPLLAKLPDNLPISIFFTSRRDQILEKRLPKSHVVTEHVEIADTLKDIRLLLEDSREDLPVSDEAAEDLIEKLVQKSQGSFLWTRLILQKLETTWSEEAIESALETIPDGLRGMYLKILEDMAQNDEFNRTLAQSILRWVVCGGRSLTTVELQEAIRLDIGQRVPKLEKMLEGICGQLVVIDDHDKVQMVHDTARDFLLDPDLDSEFAIDKAATHQHLASVCLRHLLEDSKAPINRRTLHPFTEPTGQALREYASLYFSEHIAKSPPVESQMLMTQLEGFLETEVLNWIEYITSETKDLSLLTQAGKNLKSYVEHRMDFQSPLSRELKTIEEWAVDLIRLVTVFGREILKQPSAIHHIIPPLCPPNSILRRNFGMPSLGMEVVGQSARGWADRVFSSSFTPNEASSIACCERSYAVGLRDGTVVVYYASTCQEACRFSHSQQVRHLEFAHGRSWLVACGRASMSLWNYESVQMLWNIDLPSEPMALTFTDDDSAILAACKSNEVIQFDTARHVEPVHVPWRSERRPPQKIYLSSEMHTLALVYRNKPIILHDLDDLQRPRLYDVQASVSALAFNAAANMIAVGFFDGQICTIGMWNLREQNRTEVDASHLAVSTDGNTLLVGTNLGSIQVRDFDSLQLMYAINFEDDEIVSLAFASNSLRFLDIRRDEFNVWEPSALFRRKEATDGTTGEDFSSYSTAPSQLVHVYTQTDKSPITAIAVDHKGDFVLCGNEDGTVAIYETVRGKLVKELFKNKTAVMLLYWNSEIEISVCSDNSSRISVHRISQAQTRSSTGTRLFWQPRQFLDLKLDEPVRHISVTRDAKYLLVSTLSSDRLWTLDGERMINLDREQGIPRSPSQKWAIHPRSLRRIFNIDHAEVKLIRWRDNNDQPETMSHLVKPQEHIGHHSREIEVHVVRFADDAWAAYDTRPTTLPVVWTGPYSSSSKSNAVAVNLFGYFNQVIWQIATIIGMYRSHLVFLNVDNWICTIRLDDVAGQERMKHHFPVPHCWQTSSRSIIATVSVRGHVIIARGDELAIVKRGLSL